MVVLVDEAALRALVLQTVEILLRRVACSKANHRLESLNRIIRSDHQIKSSNRIIRSNQRTFDMLDAGALLFRHRVGAAAAAGLLRRLLAAAAAVRVESAGRIESNRITESNH